MRSGASHTSVYIPRPRSASPLRRRSRRKTGNESEAMIVAHNSSFTSATTEADPDGASAPTPDLDGYTAEDETHPYDLSAPEVEGGDEGDAWDDPTGQS